MQQLQADSATQLLIQGGVIAYPTEAVYGLGCDPDNLEAVQQVLAIKQRPWQKGMILIGGDLSQFDAYVDWSQLTSAQIEFATKHWPGPYTFIVPVKSNVSHLVRGEFDTIAIRVTTHPVVKTLCQHLGKPLISTSANLAGEAPIVSGVEILKQFSEQVDGLVLGELGQQQQPSTIIDARTGQVLR